MRPSKKGINSSYGRYFGSWGYTLAASDKKPTPQGDERSPSRAGVQDNSGDTGDRSRGVWLDAMDFTPEETWRLLRWCLNRGRRVLSLLLLSRRRFAQPIQPPSNAMTVEKTFGTLWVAACVIACVGGLALGGVVGCVGGVALAVIIPILFLIGLFSFKRQRLARQFKRDFEGRWLLVCSRSGHWGPFFDNNVLTVLPEGVQVVWLHPRRSGREYPASAIRLLFSGVGNPI